MLPKWVLKVVSYSHLSRSSNILVFPPLSPGVTVVCLLLLLFIYIGMFSNILVLYTTSTLAISSSFENYKHLYDDKINKPISNKRRSRPYEKINEPALTDSSLDSRTRFLLNTKSSYILSTWRWRAPEQSLVEYNYTHLGTACSLYWLLYRAVSRIPICVECHSKLLDFFLKKCWKMSNWSFFCNHKHNHIIKRKKYSYSSYFHENRFDHFCFSSKEVRRVTSLTQLQNSGSYYVLKFPNSGISPHYPTRKWLRRQISNMDKPRPLKDAVFSWLDWFCERKGRRVREYVKANSPHSWPFLDVL